MLKLSGVNHCFIGAIGIYSSESDERLRLPYLFSKRSTRPAVSTIVIVPVKNGWLVEEIGTFARGYSSPSSHLIVSSVSMVDRSDPRFTRRGVLEYNCPVFGMNICFHSNSIQICVLAYLWTSVYAPKRQFFLCTLIKDLRIIICLRNLLYQILHAIGW